MKLIAIALLAGLLAACATPSSTPPPAPGRIGLANPASVYCGQQGGQLELRKDATGGAYGVCTFKDGRECEEWALFRDHQCVAADAAKH